MRHALVGRSAELLELGVLHVEAVHRHVGRDVTEFSGKPLCHGGLADARPPRDPEYRAPGSREQLRRLAMQQRESFIGGQAQRLRIGLHKLP